MSQHDQSTSAGEMEQSTVELWRHSADWLSKPEVQALTPEVMTQRMIALQPLLREHSREAERRRRPADEVIAAIRRSGYFYMMIPKIYGGIGATPEQLLDATIPLGEACSSTAWVAAFAAEHNWLLGHFPEETLRDTWGGSFPYVFAPAVANPPGFGKRVKGGYQLNGHWRWGTCSTHADWVICFSILETNQAPELAAVLVPASDVSVIDTWHTDGMRSTGSHDILVKDIFVPEHRTAPLAPVFAGTGDAMTRMQSEIYGMPLLPFLAFAASLAAVGGARSVVSAVRARQAVHKSVGESAPQAEKPLAQVRLARSTLLARTGELLIRDAAREMPLFYRLTDSEKLLARVRWRAQISEGMHLCNEAIAVASASAGSSLHFLDNPIQRTLRDVAVQSTHIGFDQDTAHEQLGRVLVGLQPNTALY